LIQVWVRSKIRFLLYFFFSFYHFHSFMIDLLPFRILCGINYKSFIFDFMGAIRRWLAGQVMMLLLISIHLIPLFTCILRSMILIFINLRERRHGLVFRATGGPQHSTLATFDLDILSWQVKCPSLLSTISVFNFYLSLFSLPAILEINLAFVLVSRINSNSQFF